MTINYSLAIFPFLKTSQPASIGNLTFRSTDATNEFSSDKRISVSDVARMLYLQDNLRLKSASCAVIPFVDLENPATDVEHLMNVQAAVAFLYSSPHPVRGDPFLSSEHASMIILTPRRVFLQLVQPNFHVEEVGPALAVIADARGEIEGYAGLYNFRHYFWVTRGSRLYGPMPHMSLNHMQDLGLDIETAAAKRVYYRLLFELLRKPLSETSSRIFTALRWFNSANSETNDDAAAILDLSIAFETLLSLPVVRKTDHFTDAISLLLGRIPRVANWAQQFYDARSRVVHEGRVRQLRFIATDSRKVSEGPLYQPLLSYGRLLFQLCLGTILTGAKLSEEAGLEQKLMTNQERFQKICKILSDEKTAADERLNLIAPIVAVAEEHKFLEESALQLETMLCATRLAIKSLLQTSDPISEELKEKLAQFSSMSPTKDHFLELDALRRVKTVFDKCVPRKSGSSDYVRDVVSLVWGYGFLHYFWLKERIEGIKDPQSSD